MYNQEKEEEYEGTENFSFERILLKKNSSIRVPNLIFFFFFKPTRATECVH